MLACGAQSVRKYGRARSRTRTSRRPQPRCGRGPSCRTSRCYSAASGMSAQQMNVDNIAHNLANANTVGFKMRRAQFQDLLYQNLVQPGAAAGQQTVIPSGLQLGLGTRAASNEILFTQGNFSQTENPLDL